MFDLPLYRMEVVYGLDEDGDPCTMVIFENIVEPEKDVPAFHKLGMAGEAQADSAAGSSGYSRRAASDKSDPR